MNYDELDLEELWQLLIATAKDKDRDEDEFEAFSDAFGRKFDG